MQTRPDRPSTRVQREDKSGCHCIGSFWLHLVLGLYSSGRADAFMVCVLGIGSTSILGGADNYGRCRGGGRCSVFALQWLQVVDQKRGRGKGDCNVIS